MVIGGSEVYKISIPYLTRMYLTHLNTGFHGDKFFPYFRKKIWKRTFFLKRKNKDVFFTYFFEILEKKCFLK